MSFGRIEIAFMLIFDHENYFNMGSMFGEIGLAGAESKKWRVTACEPVYDETPRARADFFFCRMNKLLKIR